MSVVTDIILVTGLWDGGQQGTHPNADKLSKYLEDHHNGVSFKKVDEFAGGSKCIQCDIFMAGINHLNKDDFIDHFKSIKWQDPESVQLFLKGEQEDKFTIYETENEAA